MARRCFFLLLLLSIQPTWADSAIDSLLAAVVKQARADEWDKKTVFVAADFGGKHYVCRLDSGALVRTEISRRPEGGVAGEWAELFAGPLDGKMHLVGQGAGWVLHRVSGTWRVVATDEGVGYAKKALNEAKVPPDVIKKLKINCSDD